MGTFSYEMVREGLSGGNSEAETSEDLEGAVHWNYKR